MTKRKTTKRESELQPLEPPKPPTKCSKCPRPVGPDDFIFDKQKGRYKTVCKACQYEYYNTQYYPANAPRLVKAELARREGKPKPTGPTFHSLKVRVEFTPLEVKDAHAAYQVEFGKPPESDEVFVKYLTRYCKAGVNGNSNFRLKKGSWK